MKLQLAAPFLAALSLSTTNNVAAFQTQSLSRAFVHKASHHNGAVAQLMQQQRSMVSASTALMAESLAEKANTTSTTTATQSIHQEETQQGEVLSIQTLPNSSSSFAVVKMCEEDLLVLPTTLSAAGVGVAGGADGSVHMAGEDGVKQEGGEKVELKDKMFSKSAQPKPAANNGATANGDITGRTVTFSNSSKGIIVAHRHPIAFVLVDSSSPPTVSSSTKDSSEEMCTISTKSISLNPSSIPSGSTIDYLGRHVSVLNDGSVSRSLPKAAALGSGGTIDWATRGAKTADRDANTSQRMRQDKNNQERPIFVAIPKISEIGLIDSPLVTGITAIDALTPIGKGQNMLVIGEDDTVAADMGVNKREWMINLLRNVVENHRGDDGSKGMKCFYGLTSGDGKVKSSVWNGIKEAGIQDDIVTVVSNHDSNAVSQAEANDDATISTGMSMEKAMEAAEAVAVAAAACTLGEHHALTTGGDSVVVIDDINLHKDLWDITTQELVRVYGVDAVVDADLNGGSSSELRGFFSGLIQRAARYSSKKGGGSVTLMLLSTLPNPIDYDTHSSEDEPTFEASDFDAMSEKIQARLAMLVKAKVPLTASNLRKIKIPVPQPSASEDVKRLALQHVDDLISMSDGQVWLDSTLAKQGRSPPLDPSRSLTRVGVGADTRTCRADAPALRSVVGSLRFEFQQAMDVMDSSASSSALSATSAVGDTKAVRRRDAFLLAMHQEPKEMRKLSQECIALLAASRGHLDGVIAKGGMAGTSKGKEAMEGMLEYVGKEAGEIVQSIDLTLDLALDERNVLDEAIESYFD